MRLPGQLGSATLEVLLLLEPGQVPRPHCLWPRVIGLQGFTLEEREGVGEGWEPQ